MISFIVGARLLAGTRANLLIAAAFLALVELCSTKAKAQQHMSICTYRTTIVNGVATPSCQPVGVSNPLPTTGGASQYPTNATTGAVATPKASVGSGTTGAVTASLGAVAGQTNYLCSFSVSAAGTGNESPITVTGVLGGTLTYQVVAAGGAPFVRNFTPCLPASAVNTAIAISTTADASATAVNVDLQGFGL